MGGEKQVNKTTTVIRTEKKYEITEQKKALLIRQLLHVMKMDENGNTNGYQVRSLYFDSIYDDDYFDKLDGLELRKKIRLRIYSPSQEQVKLEIKQKQGAAQQKRSMWIPKETALEMMKGNYSLLLDMKSELAEELYQMMERGVYRPKCIIEYNRIAFMEDVNSTRITFDSNLRASSFCHDFFKPELSMIPVLNMPVLEVKYNGFLLSNLKNVLNMADSSEIAISKYAISRMLLG